MLEYRGLHASTNIADINVELIGHGTFRGKIIIFITWFQIVPSTIIRKKCNAVVDFACIGIREIFPSLCFLNDLWMKSDVYFAYFPAVNVANYVHNVHNIHYILPFLPVVWSYTSYIYYFGYQ